MWKGPDEVVWNFTALSQLFKSGIHKVKGEWWLQTPHALSHAEKEATQVMPKLREGARLVRTLDAKRRPLWINEAAKSDLGYIRQYIDSIDITGCDQYPIHERRRNPPPSPTTRIASRPSAAAGPCGWCCRRFPGET